LDQRAYSLTFLSGLLAKNLSKNWRTKILKPLLVFAGTSVDGRPTVPGLHTDCVPGELRSDCSGPQEDGAWSTDAESWLNKMTGGKHSSSMQSIQVTMGTQQHTAPCKPYTHIYLHTLNHVHRNTSAFISQRVQLSFLEHWCVLVCVHARALMQTASMNPFR
jgi:hypothetical protein